jgi:hypothetical protein
MEPRQMMPQDGSRWGGQCQVGPCGQPSGDVLGPLAEATGATAIGRVGRRAARV